MIVWLNGAFGAGKASCAHELHRRIPGSFVYDPENIGYFLRRNTPKSMHAADFQDDPLWRAFNCRILRDLSQRYSGTIIVPMTLVRRAYFDEIITRLRTEGADIRHYILWASPETLTRRLSRRREGRRANGPLPPRLRA